MSICINKIPLQEILKTGVNIVERIETIGFISFNVPFEVINELIILRKFIYIFMKRFCCSNLG